MRLDSKFADDQIAMFLLIEDIHISLASHDVINSNRQTNVKVVFVTSQ